jgi:hypothetical protein
MVQDLDACERSLIERSPLEHIAIQVSSNDLIYLKIRTKFLLMNGRISFLYLKLCCQPLKYLNYYDIQIFLQNWL